MNKYELTHSELATAEAITDRIMDKIGNAPQTEKDLWHTFIEPFEDSVKNAQRAAQQGQRDVDKFRKGVDQFGQNNFAKPVNGVINNVVKYGGFVKPYKNKNSNQRNILGFTNSKNQ